MTEQKKSGNKLIQFEKDMMNNEEIIDYVADTFKKKVNKKAAKQIIKELCIVSKDDSAEFFIGTENQLTKSFIYNNTKRLDIKEEEKDGKTIKYFYIKPNVGTELLKSMYNIQSKTNDENISYVDEKNDDIWMDQNPEGKYKVDNYLTYNKLERHICENGSSTEYIYNFNNVEPSQFKNVDTLQVLKMNVLSSGQETLMPLKYTYVCTECGKTSYKYPYEVSSTNNRIKCPGMVEITQQNGNTKMKRCNEPLGPAINLTKTKPVYIYNGSYKFENNGETERKSFKLLSFKKIPTGELTLAVVRVPTVYDEQFLFVVDYQPVNEKHINVSYEKDRHAVFTLMDTIQTHIKQQEGYEHFGFMPIKIATLIQYAANIFDKMPNNFHLALVGDPSTGKTAYANYWGATLYGMDIMSLNATDISVPSLRGSKETIKLFNKEINYRTDGFLNKKRAIIINELKTVPELKKELKGYLFDAEFSFGKVGGDEIPRKRNAQLLITENVDPKHKANYKKHVKNFYKSDECDLDEEIYGPKPAWNDKWDLEIPLHKIENDYLRLAVYKVRHNYQLSNKNWIDGDEIASDDRFIFYFYVANDNPGERSKKFDEVIANNKKRSNQNIEVSRLRKSLFTDSFYKYMKECEQNYSVTGSNHEEYFNKLSDLLQQYEPEYTVRQLEIYQNMMDILRIIDKRTEFNDTDIKILQYLIENSKTKIHVSETDRMHLNGPRFIDIPEQREKEIPDYFNE